MSFSFIKNNPFFFFFSQTKTKFNFIHFYLNNPVLRICSAKIHSAFFQKAAPDTSKTGARPCSLIRRKSFGGQVYDDCDIFNVETMQGWS